MRILNLLLIALVFSLSPLTSQAAWTLSLNSYPSDAIIERTNEAWSCHYQRTFTSRTDAAEWEQELELQAGGWKLHPKFAHIRGYNGDIAIKIIAPGKITALQATAKMTNYADSRQRTLSLSYSLNGIDFLPLDRKTFTSTVSAEGSAEPADNRGILWLRLNRELDSDDSNGKSGFVLLSDFSFTLSGQYPETANAQPAAAATGTAIMPGNALQNFFPTGVFWPWERTRANADFAGMELWAFVEQTMQTLREHHCNTLWFVNIGPGEEARRILELAEKHGLKVLLNTEMVTFFYHGMSSVDQAETLARRTVNKIGDMPALLGYVLKDEPLLCSVGQLSFLYQTMKRIDPLRRDSVAVVMNRQTQTYLEQSELPVICTDIYYFGHDHSTNIPNPARVSQMEFRHGVKGMNAVAERHGKHSWLMPQMFGDVWGRHHRRGDKTIVEPGAYLHWRMPTLAETRWQIWEGLRLGSKGMVFYVLYPPVPLFTPPAEVAPDSPDAKKVAQMDRQAAQARSWQKQKLTETTMEIDPGEGMLQPGGKPTPQMTPMGEAFRVIRAQADNLSARRSAPFPAFFAADALTETATFRVPGESNVLYGIVVNSDLLNERQVQVLLPANISRLTLLNREEELPLAAAAAPFKACTLTLAAGDGALLRAEFTGTVPGIMFLRESFAQHDQHIVKLNRDDTALIRYGSFGMFPFYGVKLTGSGTAPVFTVENLTNRKSAVNTILMNLNSSRRQGTVFCQLEGKLDGVRLFAVDSSADPGEQTNVMHLQENNLQAGPNPAATGKVTLLQEKNFFTPCEIPVGTTSLQVFMAPGQSDALISNMTIWFVPD